VDADDDRDLRGNLSGLSALGRADAMSALLTSALVFAVGFYCGMALMAAMVVSSRGNK